MLDVSVRHRDIALTFAKSTHTAIVGPPAAGISTLLRVIAGDEAGQVTIAARNVSKLRRGQRPLLYVTRTIDAPPRWSVRHLLIAAVRQRSLDRVDRQHEFELAVAKWKLTSALDRSLREISSTEYTLANAARIELLKPAILLADRVLDHVAIADEFYRTLRVLGTTVISAPTSTTELGFTDRVVVIENGRVIQEGTFSQIYRYPTSTVAARATGDVNLVPAAAIGLDRDGIAAIRPEDFHIAAKGEESDFIFGIEEAIFQGDHWRATGILTGNVTLTVHLPADTAVHKGRLLPMRFDPKRAKIFSG